MSTATQFNFTTGPTCLPDVGQLSYNGCLFGPLFETKVSGKAVGDNAKRTIKYIEYSITVDGYVTLPEGSADISGVMATLYNRLTAQGGQLIYRGRALDIIASGSNDVAWGPIPELLEFQPLGAGRSAKISWRVTTRLSPPTLPKPGGGGTNAQFVVGGNAQLFDGRSLGIIQLNYDTTVSYGADGYSTISIRGTLEAPPMGRTIQSDRKVDITVDRYRAFLEDRILKGIDLARFTVTRREFQISRDKRTMEWDFAAEEKPYMDLPPHCTVARGTYTVRQEKQGLGVVKWLCTLRATYTVRADYPRKTAYWAFLGLLFLRMQQTLVDDPIDERNQDKPKQPLPLGLFDLTGIDMKDLIEKAKKGKRPSTKPWLIDFSMDEGLYQDSKTVSFSATWRLISRLSHIILTSGMWRKLPDGGKAPGKNLWAISMASVMGTKSWLRNELDPSLDVIIDLGSSTV